MGEWWRKIPHPTIGPCGGASKDCAIRREDLDPLQQLFYDHDNGLREAQSEEEREMVDQFLHEALKTFDEWEELPFFRAKFPFFYRWYAKAYVATIVKTGLFDRSTPS